MVAKQLINMFIFKIDHFFMGFFLVNAIACEIKCGWVHCYGNVTCINLIKTGRVNSCNWLYGHRQIIYVFYRIYYFPSMFL
jgi:hypothetical protein